ncbi:MAG: carboxynorspermidine decarboxylase [Chitinophagales bacterium]|nr:carboxynorspermidine decarboxylase [Chitinophagales bacterium]MCZ2393588.1 carboxynorspermidine decarboxylase [Chitinophagales bacterium]
MKINWREIPSPCYVLEEERLIKNLQLMKYVQESASVDIICALKGYSLHATFPTLLQYLHGATASSLHEARLVYEKMGVKAHTYCAVYVPQDFDEIQNYSSHLTFNSLSEYNRWKDKVAEGISCGLRVNPGYSEVGTELYNPCAPNSRLGIARNLIGDTLPEGIEGLHFHALCENNSYTLERVLLSFMGLYDDLLKQVKWVNFGGGHLMTKEGYDIEHLIKILRQFRLQYPNIEQVILEPGSAVGWQTGYLMSTILDIVQNDKLPIAMLDVSFTCHMPDCLEMPYQPKILNISEHGKYEYYMGGLSCLAGDYMGTWKFEQPLNIGDKVIFDDMIHYTMVKTSTFNGINLPSIGIWSLTQKFQLLNSYGYEDYASRLS